MSVKHGIALSLAAADLVVYMCGVTRVRTARQAVLALFLASSSGYAYWWLAS